MIQYSICFFFIVRCATEIRCATEDRKHSNQPLNHRPCKHVNLPRILQYFRTVDLDFNIDLVASTPTESNEATSAQNVSHNAKSLKPNKHGYSCPTGRKGSSGSPKISVSFISSANLETTPITSPQQLDSSSSSLL